MEGAILFSKLVKPVGFEKFILRGVYEKENAGKRRYFFKQEKILINGRL